MRTTCAGQHCLHVCNWAASYGRGSKPIEVFFGSPITSGTMIQKLGKTLNIVDVSSYFVANHFYFCSPAVRIYLVQTYTIILFANLSIISVYSLLLF